MNIKTTSSSLAAIGIFLSGLSILSPSVAAHAQSRFHSAAEKSSSRVSFVPRSDSPAPRRTHSGGSRNELPPACGGLPILPESGIGLTTDDSPSLFVYFSQETTVEQAMLTLKTADDQEKEFYDTTVLLPQAALQNRGGVVEFKIPEVDAGLTIGQNYEWSLVLMCNGELRPDSPTLSGFIKKVEAKNIDVDEASSLDRAIAYGGAGIWYDLLSTISSMRAEGSNVTDSSQYWADVMSSVNLGVIADAPIVAKVDGME